MRRRRFLAALTGTTALAGCQSYGGSDTPTEDESFPTEAYAIPDLSLRNSREAPASGTVTVEPTPTETPSPSPSSLPAPFEESLDLGPSDGRDWVDVEQMDGPATITVTTDDGLSGSHRWGGGASFNRGVYGYVEPRKIEFGERIA